VEEIGTKSGTEILREWTRRGFDLGNHLYSHRDINTLSVEQTNNEIVRGESAISPLMKQVGKKPEFLRSASIFLMALEGKPRLKV
jgi:hypothetical protein